MTPCLRISKKVRDRVLRVWRSDPNICLVEAAARCGYSEQELDRLTARYKRSVLRGRGKKEKKA